jgi:hypothetical protein
MNPNTLAALTLSACIGVKSHQNMETHPQDARIEAMTEKPGSRTEKQVLRKIEDARHAITTALEIAYRDNSLGYTNVADQFTGEYPTRDNVPDTDYRYLGISDIMHPHPPPPRCEGDLPERLQIGRTSLDPWEGCVSFVLPGKDTPDTSTHIYPDLFANQIDRTRALASERNDTQPELVDFVMFEGHESSTSLCENGELDYEYWSTHSYLGEGKLARVELERVEHTCYPTQHPDEQVTRYTTFVYRAYLEEEAVFIYPVVSERHHEGYWGFDHNFAISIQDGNKDSTITFLASPSLTGEFETLHNDVWGELNDLKMATEQANTGEPPAPWGML